MRDDDEFLRSSPPFLRRREVPRLEAQRPEVQRPEKSPARLPGPVGEERAGEPIRPIAAPAAPAAQTAAPRIVELAVPQAETVQAGENPAGQRARIELAFDNETGSDDAGAEDVAFQVTLPRSVVRQIRLLAAKKDTTQRAIVLRALRLAGLWVPAGTDIDRRGRTAKRRQQA